jgi:myo-inositol-1(or 4)-monophosphatase
VDRGNITELRDLATSLAQEAGCLIRAGGRPGVADTKSSETDPVTVMDRAAEELLASSILQVRPDDGILGEEGHSRPGTSGLTWVIDPIDGTVNNLYGVASHAVSVAIVEGEPDPATWTVLAGAVHDVVTGRTWSAALGHGATADGETIAMRDPAPLAHSLVATGFGYAATRRALQARVLMQVLPRVRDIRRLGSAAVDLCLLAQGSVDLYYERGLNPWDMAAGSLIASEAGASISGLRGAPASYSMCVAGRGPALTDLLAILEEAGADGPEVEESRTNWG